MTQTIVEGFQALIKCLIGAFIILNGIWAAGWIYVIIKYWGEAKYIGTFMDDFMVGLWLFVLIVGGSSLLIALGGVLFNTIFS